MGDEAGALDEQTLAGKVVAEVARRAREAGTICRAVVGRDELGRRALEELGLAGVDVATTLAELESAGRALASYATSSSRRRS